MYGYDLHDFVLDDHLVSSNQYRYCAADATHLLWTVSGQQRVGPLVGGLGSSLGRLTKNLLDASFFAG